MSDDRAARPNARDVFIPPGTLIWHRDAEERLQPGVFDGYTVIRCVIRLANGHRVIVDSTRVVRRFEVDADVPPR